MEQSEETAGFHSRNCAREMPACVARSVQDRPSVTRDHLLQFAGGGRKRDRERVGKETGKEIGKETGKEAGKETGKETGKGQKRREPRQAFSNDRSPALYKIGTGEDIERATKPGMFDLKVRLFLGLGTLATGVQVASILGTASLVA